MKIKLFALLCAISLLAGGALQAQNEQKPYWQDIDVVKVNKEYPRTSFMTFDNKDNALSKKFEESKYYQDRKSVV